MTDREHAHNDNVLRPKTWSEYIGQDLIKHNIQILIKAASERNQTPEHMLFYGPPGLGKTTLAQLIALETGRAMKTTSGPALEKIGDLASLLTNVSPGDIIFIDEIHRLSKMIEEILYPAMESGVLDIVIGKGPTARTIQLELPPFTLVAATTRLALLSSPLRSRFSGGVFRLEYYSKDNIEQIISQSAQKLGIEISSDAVSEIARRSRFTPRTANYLLRRIRDYAQVHKTPINKETTGQALSLIGIDSHGLSASDRAYLEALITKFKGGSVGVKTLAAATGEEEGTIEDVIEPYLIQEGFIEKTPRGRTATDKAYNHIKS
jgi:Holliday junction DNA helicase RuvB